MTGNRKPTYTLLGVVAPVLIVVVGIFVALAGPHAESDWFGARFLVRLGIAIIAASVVAVSCSVLALIRKEEPALIPLTTGMLGLILIVLLGASIVQR